MTVDRWFLAIWIPVCAVAVGLFVAAAWYLATAVTT